MNRRTFIRTVSYSSLALAGGISPLTAASRKPWSLILLPDTQLMTERVPQAFDCQTEWIVANRKKLNIKYVLHLGDLVQGNTRWEWENARNSMSILDGKVPYSLATGNHDYGPKGNSASRETFFNEYFPHGAFAGRPGFGGAMRKESMENTYHVFNAEGQKWLIVSLEWSPRNAAVAWADRVITKHPDHNVIFVTHAYLYSDGTRYDVTKEGRQTWSVHDYGTANDPDGVNDGEAIWQKLLKKHPNVRMTFNGHVLHDGVAYLKSYGDAGNDVHQMLINFQWPIPRLPRDGTSLPSQTVFDDASLRILRFEPDGHTVTISDYSPYRDYHAVGDAHQFSIRLENVI